MAIVVCITAGLLYWAAFKELLALARDVALQVRTHIHTLWCLSFAGPKLVSMIAKILNSPGMPALQWGDMGVQLSALLDAHFW